MPYQFPHRLTGLVALLSAGTALLPGAAAADAFRLSFEPATVQMANQTALCAALGSGSCIIGTETFDNRPSGSTFTTNYGTGGVISGTYTNVQVKNADQYGGAGGTGKYPVAFASTPYSVTLSTTLATGINYFGYWLSALDQGNQVSFYRNGVDVYDFTPNDLIAQLGSCDGSNAYCTNPTANFLGRNNQLYAFVNFFDVSGSFDEIRFREYPAGGGYESDNHTVGYVTAFSGHFVSISEPGSLALLATGVLATGLFRRSRSRNT